MFPIPVTNVPKFAQYNEKRNYTVFIKHLLYAFLCYWEHTAIYIIYWYDVDESCIIPHKIRLSVTCQDSDSFTWVGLLVVEWVSVRRHLCVGAWAGRAFCN